MVTDAVKFDILFQVMLRHFHARQVIYLAYIYDCLSGQKILPYIDL